METYSNAGRDTEFPPARRKAPVSGPYLDVDFPEQFRLEFLTDRGRWMESAAYFNRDHTVWPQEDGSYILGDGSTHPEQIRCVADHGDFFLHVDGGGRGEIHLYRVVPIEHLTR